MAHPLIDDVIFALALAAWWRLRRSAYLLPHLRKCPFWSGRSPSGGFAPWIAAHIGALPLTTCSGMQVKRDNGVGEQTTDVFETLPATTLPPPRARESTSTTVPIPVPIDGWSPRPLPPGDAHRPTVPLPRTRPSVDAHGVDHAGATPQSINTSTRLPAAPRGTA